MPRLPSVSRTKEYRALVNEEARRNLPVHVYLMMLDQAARTGVMPILDEHGKSTGEGMPMKPEQRIAVTQYLIDKVLPDVPKEVYHIGGGTSEAETTPVDKLPSASTELLKQIAAGLGSIKDAEFEKP